MGKNDVARTLEAKYNKELGPGAIMIASDMVVPRRFESGSLSLDASLSGGWPGNQWVEVYGPENSGKTAITLKTIAHNQQLDDEFFTLWVASEHYDLDQASALGVDTDRIHVLSSRDMAQSYDVVLDYLKERAADAVVIDSYPALIPPQEDEKEMDEYTQAEGAKMTNKFFRKVGKAGLRNPKDPGDRPWLGIFINQPREKIGGWVPAGAKNETTPGGRGKNFAFYTRLDVVRSEWLLEGPKSAKIKVGQVIKTKAVKHKGGPPQRVAFLDFFFTEAPEHGFHRGDYDVPKDILTTAIVFGVIRKGGAWYTFDDQRWQGRDPLLASVREDSGLLYQIEKRTREAIATPGDKRSYDEDVVQAAATGARTVRRRRNREEEDVD